LAMRQGRVEHAELRLCCRPRNGASEQVP
jgi:hypothetical protein